MDYEYWCINDNEIPWWVQGLIDRQLLVHEPTPITDCYVFYNTWETTHPIYLYDGDGLYFIDDTIGIVFQRYYKNFKSIMKELEVKKIFCDFCEKEITNNKDIFYIKYRRITDYSSAKNEICKECFDDFLNFIDIKKLNSKEGN